jgi:hypothetical protein
MIQKQNGDYDVSVRLKQGWNIVAGTALEQGIMSDSEIKLSDIRAMWYYSPVLKKYYQIYPTNELDKLSVEEGRQLDEDVILTSSMWVYSEKTGTLRYNTLEDYPLLKDRKLSSGYNFVTITPDMNGKSLNEIKGTCNIDKVYHFESSIQQWSPNLVNDNFMDEKLTEDSIGLGILLRATNECNFEGEGSSDTTQPPSIPSVEECSDSDGGINYEVKGIVAKERNSYEDLCHKDAYPDDSTSKRLEERYCTDDGELSTSFYSCPNGCNDGACI